MFTASVLKEFHIPAHSRGWILAAGDTFTGALAVMLGKEVLEEVPNINAAAVIAVTRPGAQPPFTRAVKP